MDAILNFEKKNIAEKLNIDIEEKLFSRKANGMTNATQLQIIMS
jgi:hypothetical protein